jgi:hypothetical protein
MKKAKKKVEKKVVGNVPKFAKTDYNLGATIRKKVFLKNLHSKMKYKQITSKYSNIMKKQKISKKKKQNH